MLDLLHEQVVWYCYIHRLRDALVCDVIMRRTHPTTSDDNVHFVPYSVDRLGDSIRRQV